MSSDDDYWTRVHTILLMSNLRGHRSFSSSKKGEYFVSYPPKYQDLTDKQKRHVRRFFNSLANTERDNIEGKMEINVAGGYNTFDNANVVLLPKKLAAEIFMDRLRIYWEEGMTGIYFLVGAMGAALQIVPPFCALFPSLALDPISANIYHLFSSTLLFVFTLWGFIHSSTHAE